MMPNERDGAGGRALARACGRTTARCRSRWSRSRGKSLIDYVLDRLADAGVERAIVNVHYLADQIERHLASRRERPRVVISDERAEFCSVPAAVSSRRCRNSATRRSSLSIPTRCGSTALNPIWPGSPRRSTRDSMDALLLMVAPTTDSIGYAGRGDYAMLPDGRLRRRAENEVVPFVYAGAAILTPALFADAPAGDVFAEPAVRSRRRPAAACSACASKAFGCMWARRTPSPPRKQPSPPRFRIGYLLPSSEAPAQRGPRRMRPRCPGRRPSRLAELSSGRPLGPTRAPRVTEY